MEKISQQLETFKSQPLSQSECENIIQLLKMKLEFFKSERDSIATKDFNCETLKATAGVFNNATIRNIEKEIAIYLEVLEVLKKYDVEVCRL